METSRSCKSCGKRNILVDDDTGNLVCSSCGVVQDFENFQAHIGGITGPAGTYVRLGSAGTGSVYSYKETKKYEAQKVIEELTYKLGFPPSRTSEVKMMIETITEGEYGQGNWFPVLVGACCYIVMRKERKTLPIMEVANFLGCDDIFEVGRMIERVVNFLHLELPEFDIVNSYEWAIRNCPSFNQVPEDVVARLLKQGIFLVQCLVKWFVTTGRRPIPVVAAVLVFVSNLNGIQLKIEEVATDLHVAVKTCKQRYKELLDRLVSVAQALPWGKDVNVKNIMKNAPFVIHYMELKSMSNDKAKGNNLEGLGFDMDGIISDCLRKGTGNGFESYDKGYDLHYFLREHSPDSGDGPEEPQLSHECLAMIYLKFSDEFPIVKSKGEGKYTYKKNRLEFDLHECMEWWKGNSELSKKLFLKEILEKDVGFDANPPSFDRGCMVYKRRKEKIRAANMRIQRIMDPNFDSNAGKELCLPETMRCGRKRRKISVDIDSEDFIIETLLLHGVREEEIEKGHYNTLLDLHVFNSGSD